MSAAHGYDETEAVLLLEYERSSEFCNHVEGVRNILTSFFLTVVGGVVIVVDKFASGGLGSGLLGSPAVRVVALLGFVAMVGLLFVMVIA
ncbi:putative membrane protein [Saccharothrix espanaensis DSM 44229]|uniref:Putative membrane protein n=1 Tax=Saccharothrix espanaensis (strain ATCC 51144 / DSM 44229 / JCM 9112 / NBRC 15066 / NRRL 15764) TaxID=1179773 RepID=K0JX97_SACES|nr:putative membrane protein [Saccharothrix espanaensis DSM 44229]